MSGETRLLLAGKGGAEFGDDFCCGFAGFVFAVGGERDGADAGVASSAVALTDGGKVQHVFGCAHHDRNHQHRQGQRASDG